MSKEEEYRRELELEKAEGRAEGREEGRAEGKEEAKQEYRRELDTERRGNVKRLSESGMSTSQIADLLNLDLDYVRKVISK